MCQAKKYHPIFAENYWIFCQSFQVRFNFVSGGGVNILVGTFLGYPVLKAPCQGEERRRAGGGQGRLTKRKQWLPFPWITSESGTQVRTMSFVHLPSADQGAFISILSYYPGVLIASSFHASLDH